MWIESKRMKKKKCFKKKKENCISENERKSQSIKQTQNGDLIHMGWGYLIL
jgi:hypothetical protein